MAFAAALLLSFLSLTGPVLGAKQGVVGFGISPYQDLCCQACYGALSTLYLNCTTFDESDNAAASDGGGMDMAAMGTTSEECYASDRAWLQTMAYCIQQNCNVDGFPPDKQAECFTSKAVGGAETPTFHESLPATPPTIELAEDAKWLNETSLVNEGVYSATHGTLGEFARQEYLHTKYSLILYLIIIGICFACGIFAQVTRLPSLHRRLQTSPLWAKLQRILFLPALFNSRRLEPLPGRIGYLPSRTLTLFIASYVVLNIIFSCISFRSVQPNVWFLSAQFELCEYVGNRTGTFSLVNMSIAILFAGRNNLLITLTGWSQTTFITLHRWTARVAAVQAVVHSIVYTAAYWAPGYGGAATYAEKVMEAFYWWGIVATVALCLAAGVAVLPLRIQFYETFLVLHILFVILALIGCWYHIVLHFDFDYGYEVWLYLCFAFWAADRAARFGRIVNYNHLGGSKAILEVVPGCEIVQVTVFPRVATGFGPAQHSFLYLGGWRKVWENHPFSVAGWSPGRASRAPAANHTPPETEGHEKAMAVHHADAQIQDNDGPAVRFLMRPQAGMTARLKACASPRAEVRAYTEGPYAGHGATLAPLFTADTVVCVAGGIGITHVLGFLQGFRTGTLAGRKIRASKLVLAWSAREAALIEYVRRAFLRADDGAEYLFWCTGKLPEQGVLGVTPGRMDVAAVLLSVVEKNHQTAVLVCAPGGMADEVTKQVVKCVAKGFRLELVEEAFAW